ncbi:MAG: aminomethyltransferase family protein [Nitratireductor sp.]|nr:aminomethyltransferase family protein [Nitratireductor sp.]
MAGKQKEYPEVPMGLEQGPFHARIAERNFQHAWTNWMGFASPSVLDTVEFEYFAIRNQCTLFDISPMCKYDIEGPDAETVINRLVTRDIRKLKPGRVAYAIWCDEDGNVVDDGTVFRLSGNRFRLCCQEPQLAWLHDIAWGFDVAIADTSRKIAALSLQGPTSFATLRHMGLDGIGDLAPFGIRDFSIDGIELTVSRTGFTGDLGYELWTMPGNAIKLWDMLMVAGKLHGIRPIGYSAVEMARIEAGFLLPRIDFLSSQTALRTDRVRNPYELGLDWLVQFDKPHFNGKRALAKLQKRKPARKLVSIEIDGDKAAHNALVYHRKKREVGMVTSALWSPTCKRNIAFAWLQAPFGQDVVDDLWVEIYLQKELQWQRRMARCRIVEKPFFVHPRRAATPPGDF